MKVSVILPAYKRQFLKQMVQSILCQTFKDYELIIVDDASPENIKADICELNDSRITYIRNTTNIGKNDLVANWNKCLSYATGELVVLASDDDIYAPTFLEEMVKLADEHPLCNVFHCRVAVINEHNEIIHVGEPAAEFESDIEFLYQRAVKRRTQLISDFVCRTQALKDIGGYVNYPKAWYSDEMTLYKLAKEQGVWASQDVLFYWRSSNLNISSTTNDTIIKAESSLLHMNAIIGYIKDLTPRSKLDMYFYNNLIDSVKKQIRIQMMYDVSKSDLHTICKFVMCRRFKSLHWDYFWLRLIMHKVRHYVGK